MVKTMAKTVMVLAVTGCLLTPLFAAAEMGAGPNLVSYVGNMLRDDTVTVAPRTGSQLHEIEPKKLEIDLRLPVYRDSSDSQLIRLEAQVREESIAEIGVSFSSQW